MIRSVRMSRPAAVAALCLLTALAFWPVLGCGWIWDDDSYVTQNPLLRTAGGLWRIWFEPSALPQYYPLVHTTFWFEYRLWGLHALGYHVDNVLLHVGSSLLLLRLLQRLALPGALFAAALFAVHPVVVESVAWVTERKNVLSLFCALLAAGAWLRWREGGRRRSWWIATAWFAAALLAKSVVATLPAALLVVQWWRNGRLLRVDWSGVLPWLALGLASGAFTAWFEVAYVHSASSPWQLVGNERLLVAGRAPWFYLAQLLWPAHLCFSYPRWRLDAAQPAQWLPVAATVAAPLLALALQRRIGRGSAATILLYGGLLVPALGFFDVYPFRFSYVADHFQYHACIAMFAGLAALTTRAALRLRARWPAEAAAAAVLALLAMLSQFAVRDYRDAETLWRATLARNPDSTLALVNLAGILLQRAELAEARPLLEHCLELDPGSFEAMTDLAQIAHRGGQLAEARTRYPGALAIRPDNAPALRNLAELELQEGHPDRATELVQRALAVHPDFYDGHVTAVTAAAALGRWREVVQHADWVLQRTPESTAVRVHAARALLELGDDEKAVQNAGAVLARAPTMSQAREVFARAVARLLRAQPADSLRARVDHLCRSGRLDPDAFRPDIAREMRSLGATAQAEALER